MNIADDLKQAKLLISQVTCTNEGNKEPPEIPQSTTPDSKSSNIAMRKSKRIKSLATFTKKNLTLQIEEIEKDTDEANRMSLSKKPDSQEDSPIRQ